MLQAILFQYGGITVLGVNTFNMAFPAVVCYYAFRPMLLKSARQRDCRRILLRGSLPSPGRAVDGAVAEFQR